MTTSRPIAPPRLTVTFPAPTRPLSVNRANSLHWAQRRKLLDPWKEMARVHAQQAILERMAAGHVWRQHPITVEAELPFRANIRRDPHNYTGTVVKAIVDGLKAGGLVPDDTAEWVTVVDPRLVIQRDKSEPLAARVIITPRSLT